MAAEDEHDLRLDAGLQQPVDVDWLGLRAGRRPRPSQTSVSSDCTA
ncbi:hypothetical protein ACQEVB_23420 [Pseudonocardia sp. CA-107938]